MPTAKKKSQTTRTTKRATASAATAAAGTTRRRVTDPMVAYIQNIYNSSAPLLICEAVLLGVAAVLMVFRPIAMLTMMTFIVGVALILFGLYRTVAGFTVARSAGAGSLDVIFGLINVVLGVLFCAFPTGSFLGIVYVFIALFLFKAIKALVFAINMARARVGHYVLDIIVAVLLIILAIALMFFPLVGAITLIYCMALALLLYAAADIYMFIELSHLKRRVLKDS